MTPKGCLMGWFLSEWVCHINHLYWVVETRMSGIMNVESSPLIIIQHYHHCLLLIISMITSSSFILGDIHITSTPRIRSIDIDWYRLINFEGYRDTLVSIVMTHQPQRPLHHTSLVRLKIDPWVRPIWFYVLLGLLWPPNKLLYWKGMIDMIHWSVGCI
jgi:hypothetical protein